MKITSIRTKLTLSVSFLVATLVIFMALLGNRYFEREFKDSVAKHHFAMLELAADQLDSILASNSEILAAVGSNIKPADLRETAKLVRYLKSEEDSQQIFDGGYQVIDANGTIVTEWPTRPERVGKNMLFRDYVNKTLSTGNPTISAPYRSGVHPHQPVITFATPLKDSNGRLFGVLAGRHDLGKDNYLSRLGRVMVGKSGYLYMLDTQRTIIMHKDQKRVLEIIKPGINKGIDRAITGFEGTIENVNSKGVAGLTSFRHLKQAPWIIASHYPLSEAYSPINRAKGFFSIEILIVIASTVLLVWFMTRRIATPLLALADHVRALPELQGKDRQTRIMSTDEIGELANAFNEMVTTLDAQASQLSDNQEIYRFVAEFSIELAFLRRIDGSVRYVSPNCEALTGYTAVEFQSDPGLLDRIIHPLDADIWGSHLLHHDETGQCAAFDLRIITKQGATRWFSHVCHEVRTADGALVGNRGSFREVTQRHELEVEVRSQHEFVRSLLENTSTPMFVINAHHEILFWNRALAALTGASADVMVGTRNQWQPFYTESRPTLADLIMDGEVGDLGNYYQQYQADMGILGIVRAEGWYRNLSGRDRYLLFDAAPIHDSQGDLLAVVETLHDITLRKRAEESLRLFSEAVEQSASSIVITDPVGTIQYVNRMFCSISGYSKAEAIGQNPRILKSGRQGPEVYAELWQTITDGRQWHGEFHNKRKDGTLHWELVTISPITGSNGAITHFLAIKEDITDRKAIEYKLNKQQAELLTKHEQLEAVFMQVEQGKKEWEQTMDCINDMVIMVDSIGRILRCNQVVCRFTGLEYEQLLEKSWWELIFSNEVDIGNMNGETGELFHPKSGKWFYLNTYAMGDENSGKSVVTLHDLTEIRKVSDELAKAYEELKSTHMQLLQQEKMASVGQLAAGVAHEINNPMGFISSNLGTLGKYTDRIRSYIKLQDEALRNPLTPDTLSTVADARKKLKLDYLLEDIPKLIAESSDGAERVKTIVQNLKSFSRVDEAESVLVDLNECIESTLTIAWNELKYKCTVEKEYGDLPRVQCFPQQLNQVFLNLLVNSAHAIEKQGLVTVRTWQEDEKVCVSIGDNGTGIPEHIKTRIFEPFFTTKEVGKGTGLGLSISYDIIQRHKGTIDVESEVGKGTTFIIKLPVNGGMV